MSGLQEVVEGRQRSSDSLQFSAPSGQASAAENCVLGLPHLVTEVGHFPWHPEAPSQCLHRGAQSRTPEKWLPTKRLGNHPGFYF